VSGSLMHAFVCNLLPMRVIFGSGTLAQLSSEVSRLNLARVLVLTTPRHAQWASAAARSLGERYAGAFAGAAMHTPVEVTEDAMRTVAERNIDGLLAIGGGSTIGLAKAIALRTDVVQIAVPTTYSGSEMTPIVGETKDGLKTTQRSARVLPQVVLYDVDLTLDLPPEVSGVSGMNAIAHAVEALYAQDANPLVRLIALEAVGALASALPRVVDTPLDESARSNALYGAWLCGVCLGSVGMALHHKLCHVLGGAFGLPHAETHAAILPHATAYNTAAAEIPLFQLAAVLGSTDAASGLYELSRRVGANRGLKDFGMPREGIGRAVDLALANPYWNPRPLERHGLRELITRAYEGDPPQATADRRKS
jgi:maleylacetate reductase